MIIILLLKYYNSRLYYNILQRTSTRVQGLGRFPCPEAVTMFLILCTAFTLCARFPASKLFYLKQCEPVESESVEKLKCRRRRSTSVIRGRQNYVIFFFTKFQLLRKPTLGTNNNFMNIVIITIVQIIIFMLCLNTQSKGWVPGMDGIGIYKKVKICTKNDRY